MERFKPEQEEKRGRGRPAGAINRVTKLAIRQALLTGELPHELMLKWSQSGIMEMPEYDIIFVREAAKKVEEEREVTVKGKKKKKKVWVTKFEQVRRKVPKRGPDGKVLTYDKVLDEPMRLACAQGSARYYASPLAPKEVGLRPEQQLAQMRADAADYTAEVLTDLPPERLN